jgi:flagella basal body P-ring formation protein FlgA
MMPLLWLAASCLVLAPEADRITAGDLVPHWPALAAIPGGTPLGFAPAPGAQRVYRSGELSRLAARYGLVAPGVDAICVERPAVPLDRSQLLAAMQRSLPAARIEIVEFSRVRAPAGTIEFPRTGLQPGGRWYGFIRYGGERRFPVWARVLLTVPVSQVVAVEALRTGHPVTAAQVRLETRVGEPLRGNAVVALEEVVGKIPLRAFAAGTVLTRNLFAEPPEVARGDVVRVTVVQGAARLELQAMAEAEGRRGDRISLRNPSSGKRFRAKVMGKGWAAIGVPEAAK